MVSEFLDGDGLGVFVKGNGPLPSSPRWRATKPLSNAFLIAQAETGQARSS